MKFADKFSLSLAVLTESEQAVFYKNTFQVSYDFAWSYHRLFLKLKAFKFFVDNFIHLGGFEEFWGYFSGHLWCID